MVLLETKGWNVMQYDPREALDRMDQDTELMKTLIELFIKECAVYIERLHAACERQDLQDLGEIAHSIKGSTLTIGLDAAHQLAEDLEVACRQSGVKSIASFEHSTLKLIEALRDCEKPLKKWATTP